MYTQTKRKSGNFFLKRMLLASYLKVHLQVYELGHKDQGAKKVSFTGLFLAPTSSISRHQPKSHFRWPKKSGSKLLRHWGKWGNFGEQNNPHPSSSSPSKVVVFVVFYRYMYSVARTAAQHCMEGIGEAFFFPLTWQNVKRKSV